jgi:hypothetical protein
MLTLAIVFVETEMESLGQEALQKLDTDELERLCKLHGLMKKAGESKESIPGEVCTALIRIDEKRYDC